MKCRSQIEGFKKAYDEWKKINKSSLVVCRIRYTIELSQEFPTTQVMKKLGSCWLWLRKENVMRVAILSCDWKEHFKGSDIKRCLNNVGGEEDSWDQTTGSDALAMVFSSESLTREQQQDLWDAGEMCMADKEFWEGKNLQDIIKQIKKYCKEEYGD